MKETLRAWWVVVLAIAAVAALAPATALAAEGRCPGGHGAAAALDWGANGTEQDAAGFVSAYENAPEPVVGLSGATQIKVGFKFGLALLGTCTLEAWGSNEYGQLGNGDQRHRNHPVHVLGLSQVKEVAVGNAHAMALLYNGTVWTWGASEFGERGNDEKGWERAARQTEAWAVPRDEPTQVPNLSGVRQIAAGGRRDYALLANGTVLAWGEDRGGLLGVPEGSGDEESCYGETHAAAPVPCSAVPRAVRTAQGPLKEVEYIAAGEEDAFALTNNGSELLAWGNGSQGDLGDGTTAASATPLPVMLEAPTPVREIAAGSQQVLARMAGGEVYAWGSDDGGQLGFEAQGESSETCGPHNCSTLPQEVLALGHVVGVAAGEEVSFALKEEEGGSRVIYSFGAGGHYELLGLGNASIQSTPAPTPITGLGSVAAMAASRTNVVALLQSGPQKKPALTLTASEGALTLSWRLKGEAYIVRARPVGTHEFTKPQEGACHGECSVTVSGLKPEPYEVFLKTAGEAREGKEKVRKIFGAPSPPVDYPASTRRPTVTGVPATPTGQLRDGQTLTAAPGSWSGSPSEYRYSWLRCSGLGEAGVSEELGTECEKVASGATYVVQQADVAQTLVALVEASNANGTTAAASAAEVILAGDEETQPPYPLELAPPRMTGAAVEGSPLTAHHGEWENSPTAYEDRFVRCRTRTSEGTGADCEQATPVGVGATYTPVAHDVGFYIELQERAENPGGYEIATSRAVQIAPRSVPANTAPPTITGTVEQNQVLSEDEGTWTNAATNPSWQWLRCAAGGGYCTAIEGATKQTYKLGPEDVGHSIEVAETVENGVGAGAEALSAATATVPSPPPLPPTALTEPAISGTLEQGQTLTESAASWRGEVKGYTLTWKRCEYPDKSCRAIRAASEGSYTLTGTDVGKTMVVTETATNAAGPGQATSRATVRVVGAVPAARTLPAIRGIAQQGQALSEYHAAWSNEPGGYSYHWLRCNASGGKCKAIAGATARTFVPQAADVGSTVRVEEAASDATGSGAGAESAQSALITVEPPLQTTPPEITGTGAVGELLTVTPGAWSNPPSRESYQWLRCEAAGGCVPIEGATGSSYKVGEADVGSWLEVRELATNAGGWGTATSERLLAGSRATPDVTGVVPASGLDEGGETVEIIGANFTGAGAVDFAFASASSFEVVTPEEIKAVVPLGSTGTIDVTVTTAEGTSAVSRADRFTYVPSAPAPTITRVTPRTGAAAGGTTVTIKGKGFAGATAVHFGTTAAGFKLDSKSKITAVSPPGEGAATVYVTTPNGTNAITSKAGFEYIHAAQ